MDETELEAFGDLDEVYSYEETLDSGISTSFETAGQYDSDVVKDEDEVFGQLPNYDPNNQLPLAVAINSVDSDTPTDADITVEDDWDNQVSYMDPLIVAQIEEGKATEEYYKPVDGQTDIFGMPMSRSKEDSPVYQRALAEAKVFDEENNTTTAVATVERDRQMMDDYRNSRTDNFAQHFKDAAVEVNDMLIGGNALEREMAEGMLKAGMDVTTISAVMTVGYFTPVLGAALGLADIPQNVRDLRGHIASGDYKSAAKVVGITLSELALSAVGTRAVYRGVKKKYFKNGSGVSKQMAAIEVAEASEIATKRASAAKVSKANSKIKQQLIDEFEDVTGKVISTTEKGKKTISFDAARIAGREISSEVMELQQDIAKQYGAIDNNITTSPLEKIKQKEKLFRETKVGETDAYTGLVDEVDDLVSPMLNPDKFDAIVAIASDFKKANPKSFPKGKTIIDSLFELTVDKQLVDSQDLADSLAKYGLTFDDYVLTVVGSGSEAGKTLNKLSQIRRAGSLDEIADAKRKSMEMAQAGVMQTWRRIENMRRGTMVSMIKTAMRNFQSGTIRMSMESLENVIDNSLVNMTAEFGRKDKGILSRSTRALYTGTTSLVSPSNWSGSLSSLKRIYANPVQAKEITDYVLKRPEFTKQFSALFDNINEYQMATGRGKGGAVDKILSKGEDVVNMLNIPNRIQEFVIRRGVFMGELERLVKRDYGVELMDVIKDGKFGDLMANSSKVRKKGASSFEQLVEDSTRRALDVTYAKAPDVPVFSDISNFLTRTGLTAITTPFPRFMFNSMELMGQYSFGAFNPAIKRALGKKTGSLDAKDRQNISRNISGIVAFTAAYQYRNSDTAPADYKQINGEDGAVIDVTSQYPMRQFLWMAEAVKRMSPSAQRYIPQAVGGRVAGSLMGKEVSQGEGTFDDWFDPKEAMETFVGASARTGASNVFIDEIAAILSGKDDIIKSERGKKVLGRLLGDYLTTWAIPITQITELQRITGDRPDTYSDVSTYDRDGDGVGDGDKSPTVGGQIKRSFMQRGISTLFDPSMEDEMDDREFLYQEGRKSRVNAPLSLGLGITQFTKNAEYGEYLIEKGFNEFETGSTSRIPSVRRQETKLLKEILPMVVDIAKNMEKDLRKEYNELSISDPVKQNSTVEQYVNDAVVPLLKTQINDAKGMVREARKSETEPIALALEDVRNMTPDMRNYGTSEFFKQEGHAPSLLELEDLVKIKQFASGFKKAVSIR